MQTKCCLCKQDTDLFTTEYKTKPFIDNKTYNILCFTCYCVPKILDQKLDKDDYVLEETELPFCCRYLHKPSELVDFGSADSFKQAKISTNAVKSSCGKIKNPKEFEKPKRINWKMD